jgi:predicted RNase H-like HicB family nuclease
MKNKSFIVYIEQDEDGVFIGSIPALQGCHAEGKTQKEMITKLQQVLKLCLRNVNKKDIEKTKFVGIQSLDLTYA